MNSYYNHGSFPATGSAATSASMRAELQLVTTGFDKLPDLSGNQNKIIVVNSTGTGLTSTDVLPASNVIDSDFTFQDNADATRKFRFEASSVTAGQTRVLTVPDANATLVGTDTTQTLTAKTLTTPVLFGTASGTTAGRLGYSSGVFTYGDGSAQRTVVNTDEAQTLTNKTLSTGTVISAGTINNAAIGGTTPAAGAFTTLSASSTVSGTGFSTYLASPPAIGGTAAAAGSFTTLSASSNVTLSGGTANGVLYLNGSKVATSGSALTFDGTNFATTGTVSGTKLIPTGGAVTGNGMYLPASNTLGFTTNGAEGMRLDASGNLGIGSSSISSLGTGVTTLEFNGSNGGGIRFKTQSTTYSYIFSGTTEFNFYTTTTLPLIFGTNNAERMRIDSSGNVGIGTSSPSAFGAGYTTLEVKGTSGTLGGYIIATANGGATQMQLAGDSGVGYVGTRTNHPVYFLINNTEKMRLDSSGNLGLGVTPSAWFSGGNTKVIQISDSSSLIGTADSIRVEQNAYYNSGGSAIYLTTGAASEYLQSSGQHTWKTAPSGTAGNAITFTQAMTLDASGNLLVGTTTATGAKFTVVGDQHIRSGYGLAYFNSDNSGYWANYNDAGAFIFSNGTERARIDSIGQITTSFSGAGGSVGIRSATSAAASSDFFLFIGTANTVDQFQVRADGVIYAQNTTVQSLSDIRTKENIRESKEGLDVITALRPVRFDFKKGFGNNRKDQLGFVAQEIEPVFPDAVSEWEQSGEIYKSVGPGALIPVLVKAIQEQQAIIKSLTTRIDALEAK